MEKLHSELVKRFPEMEEDLFNYKNSAYCMMEELVSWLEEFHHKPAERHIKIRVINFCKWCEKQSRNEDAEKDLCTILTVGFYETLLRRSKLKSWIPIIFKKQQLLDNKEYFQTWVGENAFNLAIEEFNKHSYHLEKKSKK